MYLVQVKAKLKTGINWTGEVIEKVTEIQKLKTMEVKNSLLYFGPYTNFININVTRGQ